MRKSKFILTIRAIGRFPETEITEERFERIKAAKTFLSEALSIEEKFEILLSNYLELEKEIVSQASEQMVRIPQGHEDFFESRIQFNRKLVNLLTTSRLYVDHVHQHAGSILGKERKSEIEVLFNEKYDENFEYRFMEALRNYVQHSGFPIHRVTSGGRTKEIEGERTLVFSMELYSEKKFLLRDGKFKATVLEECPDSVDLKTTCRVYVECLSQIHASIRVLTRDAIDKARADIESDFLGYQELFGKKPLGLAAIEQDDDGNCLQEVPMLLDWDKIRVKLTKRNPEFKNLKRRYVSSEIDNA